MKIDKWDMSILVVLSLGVAVSVCTENWPAFCFTLGWILARIQICSLQRQIEDLQEEAQKLTQHIFDIGAR